MRLKLAVEQDWPKSRPVDRLPAWRVQNAIEGIRILCSVLADKRRVEQNVCETGAATEWRLGAELLEHQLLDWRSEEHTSELQSRQYLVCRLLLEKKKTVIIRNEKSAFRAGI